MEPDVKLIELVKQRPLLHDPRDDPNMDVETFDAIEEAWRDVARLLNIPTVQCKMQWRKVYHTYMKRKKNQNSQDGSPVQTKKMKKWDLEPLLGFLDSEKEDSTSTDVFKKNEYTNHESQQVGGVERERKLPRQEKKTQEKTGTQLTIQLDMDKIPIEEQSNNVQGTSSANHKLPPKEPEEKILAVVKDVCEQTRNQLARQDDPIDLFFRSLALSVKRLKLVNQINAKTKICAVVFEAELQQINNDSRRFQEEEEKGSTSDYIETP